MGPALDVRWKEVDGLRVSHIALRQQGKSPDSVSVLKVKSGCVSVGYLWITNAMVASDVASSHKGVEAAPLKES